MLFFRNRPRRRPDWAALMKDIDSGKTKMSLKKVQCNDRSQPLLPSSSLKGQFVYDSEKPNLHNQLLKQVSKISFRIAVLFLQTTICSTIVLLQAHHPTLIYYNLYLFYQTLYIPFLQFKS